VKRVSGDPERLQQVVWNLVSNAVKFTPRGGRVAVRVTRTGHEVRLAVSDSGAGIERASLPRLFERFWQSDSSTTRTHGGLGLGLAVVRHLVELHGGTVHAESEGEGRGATFTITLPALAAARAGDESRPHQSAQRAATSAPRLEGLRLLVVDDDQDTCQIIGTVLEAEGAAVRTCLSASQALQGLETWVPNILESDIAMPGEDGYTLIRKIRARKAEAGGRMMAVALTAYGGDEDRMRALSAGFQMHLGKPIEPNQLVSAVASVAGHS
jgi:CheY-like chemotaxis protein/anti-sigma regulatory factor (Ser/Thr protein kinase)